jgi:Ni/Co efflux regulator RcnB
MKAYVAAAFAVALFAVTGSTALAQTRNDQARQQGHTQFDEHDRQVTNDWYKQRQNNPPAGLRSQDRLSAEQESRVQPGRKLDPDLQRRTHPIPSDLVRQLPPPPRNHRYVALGGHVGLLDQTGRVLRDVIHLHN